MSDEEIKLDLQQQRFEKALAGELEKTSEVIQKTGIFSNIDKLYGIPKSEEGGEEGGETGEEGGSEGADFGGGMDLGTEPAEVTEPAAAEPEAAAEGFNVEKDFPLIMERNKLKLKGLNEAVNRTNKSIDKINDEVDSLLRD